MRCSNENNFCRNNSIRALNRRRLSLPDDMRAVIDELIGRYETIRVDITRRALLQDIIETVERAVYCEHSCCFGRTREERLREVLR